MGPDPAPPAELVAGKYKLSRLLGRGGMGSVWEGVHSSLGTHVAVKFIENEYVDSSEARSRFENEARAAAKLNSKHVVTVYDHGVMSDGRPYIVMEYLAGEPLDVRLARVGRLDLTQTAKIVQHVCRALTRAHAAGIIHRDLKPENIFLVRDEDEGTEIAKVVDFGIAKFTESSGGLSSSTKTGSVLGTPYFMSPEQARGLRSIDHRTDLWSVGVIAYRCVTGELPFIGEAVGDLLVQICVSPLPVPSQKVPGLPTAFDAWLTKALAREPAQRFQNATEVADALGAIVGLAPRGAAMSLAHPETVVSSAPTLAAPSEVAPFSRMAEGVTAAPFTQNASPVRRNKPIALIVGSAAGLVLFLMLLIVFVVSKARAGAAGTAATVEGVGSTNEAVTTTATAVQPSASVAGAPSVVPTVEAPASASAEPSDKPAAKTGTHVTSKTGKTGSGKTGTGSKTGTGTKPSGGPDIGY